MLRTFLTSSRRLLVPRPLPALNRGMPGITAPGTTTVLDVRRNIYDEKYHQPFIPFAKKLKVNPIFEQGTLLMRGNRSFSSRTDFSVPNPVELACNLLNMVKCVDLNDLKDAPPSTFWVVMVYSASQLGVPFLQILGGYSPVMTLYQLYSAAVTLTFNGGTRWGVAVSKDQSLTPVWENMRLALIPPGIAITGLMLPYPLGFVTIASGTVVSLYIDLKSCTYGPSYNAMNLLMALSSVVGLLFGLSGYVLFHNRCKKKVLPKEDEPLDKHKESEENVNEKKTV